jgi:hypothetical protein
MGTRDRHVVALKIKRSSLDVKTIPCGAFGFPPSNSNKFSHLIKGYFQRVC